MTPERWQQADQLLQAALDLPEEERVAYLAEACADDGELRREVETLLQFQQQLNGFLDKPPVSALSAVFHTGQVERAGQTLSRYQVVRSIGRGGMGEVYLARDEQLGRRVALKLLPERYTLDPDRLSRFRQEARAASALNHPNILTIYEIGEVDGAPFIAAEFVEGRTLRTLIENSELHLGTALDIAIQAANALEAAHRAGIIHRDIKPENLMLRPDGYVKVLDFGLAKLSERTPATNSHVIGFPTVETQSGIVMGTISYMSPEQARGLEVDVRTDLFSLGVVLYEMIAGCQPFAGPTSSDVLVALLNAEPAPLTAFVPQIPGKVQQIVSRALAKEREDRYQSTGELLDELKRLKQEIELKAQLRRIDSAGSERGATLEMSLGRAANSQTDKSTIDTRPLVARSTSRLRALFDVLKSRQFRVARWPVLMASALLILTLTVWSVNKYLHPARSETLINTLAVLPFINVGNDPQMEHLPDGITESIIDSLSQLSELTVMARSTVFNYKDREVDPRQVGEKLKVRAVVTGRVERQGERLIIWVELVDALNGAQLWGDRYQFPLAEILTVQEEIAREISGALRLRLSGKQQRQIAKRHTANSEAYQLYLMGHRFHYQFTRESQQKALDYFQQAIALDPNYALAYAEVAWVYADMSGQYLLPGEAMPKARHAAELALAADETLAEAHSAMALVKWWGDWDWPGAEREFRRALELNPNLEYALAHYIRFLSRAGRFEEALRQSQRAEQLDPISALVSQEIANALYSARQYDRVIEHCHKALEINFSGVWVGWIHGNLGNSYLQKRMYSEAIAELQQFVKITNRHDLGLSELGYAYAVVGQKNEARRILQEMEEQSVHRRVSPVYIARIYIGLGDKDRALELLRKGYDEHSDHMLKLAVEPVYDGLRSDPRFVQMLRGIGLAP